MKSDWSEILQRRVELYGHRNWIVVADSAYPAQANEGIETILVNQDQTAVVESVVEVLRGSRHVTPTIYTDKELQFIPEQDAPGIASFRKRLAAILLPYAVCNLPHEEIIAQLDRAGRLFQVLVIKTSACIPYTSVFFELGCKYWDGQAETRLRTAMQSRSRHQRSRRPKGRRSLPVQGSPVRR